MKKLILVEFNELSPHLLQKWMASGDLPNFKKLHDQAVVYTTVSDELEPSNMEPWIQWYSIHTGLPYSQHKVFHLTDGPRAGHTDIWQHLHSHGKRVWNCSSMNARQFSYDDSVYLPDPWCTSESAHPEDLNKFHRFVSRQVQEYSNSNKKSDGDAVQFLAFMLRHGLSFSTLRSIVSQLLGEVASSGRTKWQRVSVQDRLLFDVFAHYFKKYSPDFSTFFANSTAHLQHSYWRHMEPESFSVKPSRDELSKYGDAIFFGYKKMDLLLGEIARLASNEARIVFATALSQQPYLKYEHIGGHNFYRPKNIEALLDYLKISRELVQPVMTHQFLLRCATVEEGRVARMVLESLTFNGDKVFGFDEAEAGSLYFGCQLRTNININHIVSSKLGAIEDFRFSDQFYKIDGLKSGRHHPDGCLWIQSSVPRVVVDKVSILDIFPTVSKLLNVPVGNAVGQVLTF